MGSRNTKNPPEIKSNHTRKIAIHTVDGSDILQHLGCIKLMNTGISTTSTGAGFLPSTVLTKTSFQIQCIPAAQEIDGDKQDDSNEHFFKTHNVIETKLLSGKQT